MNDPVPLNKKLTDRNIRIRGEPDRRTVQLASILWHSPDLEAPAVYRHDARGLGYLQGLPNDHVGTGCSLEMAVRLAARGVPARGRDGGQCRARHSARRDGAGSDIDDDEVATDGGIANDSGVAGGGDAGGGLQHRGGKSRKNDGNAHRGC